MKAIILAAGVGARLGTAHAGPKCLLEFGGRSLLARHFEHLARLGIEDVTL
ncbi:MAG: NTP transferase domain-containing protein, partial [Gammaproteobacteria bacterium]